MWKKTGNETTSSYTLPMASSTDLGGVKVGTGLVIDGVGVLSATGGGTIEGAVDPRDINYVEVLSETTGNLFFKDTIETFGDGGYYDQPSGNWRYDSTYISSALIPVTEGQSYISQFSVLRTYWTELGIYVTYTRDKTHIVPSGVKYARIAILKTQYETEMFYQGTVLPTTYQAYGETPLYKLPSKTFIPELRKDAIDSIHLSSSAINYVSDATLENYRLDRARGKVNLFVETPYNAYNQPIHPKVIAFPSAWNGYKYWMAYTPFPYAIASEENPCICASNDLIHWVTPTGLTNPIDNLEDSYVTYWSDTHLVYREDLNRLECWYRGYKESPQAVYIVRKTTTDGVTWSTRETLHTVASTGGFLSHSVIYENSKYKIWIAGTGKGMYESVDGTSWTGPVGYGYNDTIITMGIWHFDVEKTDIGYEMVTQPVTNSCPTIEHYISDDGITWRDKKTLVQKHDTFGIDVGGFYRPCLLKISGIYYLFYSTIDSQGARGITLSVATKADDILSLQGIDAHHQNYMAVPTRKPKGGQKGQVVFDESLNKMIMCTTGGRYAVWKDYNGVTV